MVDLQQPFVIDLEQLSKGKQLRFLGPFFDRLYDKNREPLVLFCDEADRYAPQKPMSPEANICLGATEDIAKRGRKHGIFPVFITQRNASLNKNVSELCDIAVVFRTAGPNDQDAVTDWFGTKATREQRDEVMGKLAGLATGTAIFCSAHPELKLFSTVPVRLPWTFDSSATPEIGKRQIKPKRLAKPDLEQIKERMAFTIKEAKANNPAELRRQVAELTRQLKKVPTSLPTAKETRLKIPVIKAALAKKLESTLAKIQKLTNISAGYEITMQEHARQVGEAWQTMNEICDATVKALQSVTSGKPLTRASVIPIARAEKSAQGNIAKADAAWDRHVKSTQTETNDKLPPGEYATLKAALQYPGLDRKRLSILTGYKRSSRDAYIARLSQKGFVELRGTALHPTQAGADAIGSFDPLPTGTALIEYWRTRLPEGERKTLEVLIAANGEDVDREKIDEQTGYKRSSRDAYLARLKARGLAEFSGRGQIRASAELFA